MMKYRVMQQIVDCHVPEKTPLQLAREMAECRMLYLSSEDDEARDHWRGEYETCKRRFEVVLERLKKSGGE